MRGLGQEMAQQLETIEKEIHQLAGREFQHRIPIAASAGVV